MIVGVLVLPEVIVGITEASHTLRPSIPCSARVVGRLRGVLARNRN